MDALQNLFNRRSVRDFTAQPIEEEKLHRILEAGMSGPCCVNARDWSFIVVTDREKLLEMAEANGRPAQPLKKAAAAHSDLRRSRACIPTREGLLGHRRRHCRAEYDALRRCTRHRLCVARHMAADGSRRKASRTV